LANDWQPRLKQLDMFAKHSGCIKSCDTDRRNDWQEVSLASACIKVTDGSHFSPTPRNHGRPIANVKDLRPGFVDFLSCTKIAEEDFQALVRNGCDVQRHDVLLSKDGTIGRVVVYQQDEPLVTLSSIAILRPGKALDPFFLGQALQSSHVMKQIGIFAGGSALHRLVLRDIHRILIPLPSLAEQRRIAAVLDTIDEAIAKTEVVIAKFKQVRSGLLHDLLTRGINENGQLRDPIAYPKQFQDSFLGRIPREWEIVRVGNETDIEHGFAFDGRLFSDKPLGPRLLVPGNFHRDGGLYFTDANTKYFAGNYPPNTVLANGDILIVMTDLSPMTLILGRTVLLNEPFKVLHNQRIGKFRFKQPGTWNPEFFVALMNDDRLRGKIILEATGTTVRHTSPDRIKSGIALKPPREEQDRVISVVRAVDSYLQESATELSKLVALKSGLMSDLLTSRVRVPEEIAVAS